MTRIAFIGAGSIVFTRSIVSDLLTYQELADATLVLHDIDPERLATAEAMTKSMIGLAGAGNRLITTPDLGAAVDGADYVINSVAIGGFAAVQRDFDIPRRFGIRQTIADTLGIGGIFRALRTIPFMVELGNRLVAHCPDALLLTYSNPMSIVPRAVYEGTPFTRVVGLCHSARDTQNRLATLVGVPVEEIAFVTAGVNHQAFVLQMTHRGRDLRPALAEVIANDPELQRTVRGELFRTFGYFPTESSEHGSEYLPWFLHLDAEIEHYRIPVDLYLSWCEDLLATYSDMREQLERGEQIPIEPTSELASEVIHSIETGLPRIVHGNVRNGGQITNLPEDACVEVPCLVDRAGVRSTRVGALPAQLAALNQAYLNVGELTLLAALEGRRDHVYQAALVDPATAATLSVRRTKEMVDELIAAHADLMPEGIRD